MILTYTNELVTSTIRGCLDSPATTIAMSCSRASSTNWSARKLSWRTSTVCRISRSPMRFGNSARKREKSSRSNFLVAANCQLIGPSLSPSSSTPLAKKRDIESPASASRRRLVAKRGPFTAKTKSSGVSSRHFMKLSGQQPAGEILQADSGGPETARGRNSALEAHVFRDCADSGACLRRTYGARVVYGSVAKSKGAGEAEKAGARPRGGAAVSSCEARGKEPRLGGCGK